MPLSPLMNVKENLEIQAIVQKGTCDRSTCIPYSGSPRKHPFETDRILLIADPFTTNTFYYEFNLADIGYVEELPRMTNIDGEAVSMARIWVKKGSMGVRCTPFLVENLPTDGR